MRALSYRSFWPCDGRRMSLGYLSAGGRYTARHHALATLTLIFINDDDAIAGPAPGDCTVHQAILPRGGLHVIEDLLGMGLAHIDESLAPQMMVLELRHYPADRSQRLLSHRPPPA